MLRRNLASNMGDWQCSSDKLKLQNMMWLLSYKYEGIQGFWTKIYSIQRAYLSPISMESLSGGPYRFRCRLCRDAGRDVFGQNSFSRHHLMEATMLSRLSKCPGTMSVWAKHQVNTLEPLWMERFIFLVSFYVRISTSQEGQVQWVTWHVCKRYSLAPRMIGAIQPTTSEFQTIYTRMVQVYSSSCTLSEL